MVRVIEKCSRLQNPDPISVYEEIICGLVINILENVPHENGFPNCPSLLDGKCLNRNRTWKDTRAQINL